MRSFIKISGTVFNLQSGHDYMVEMVMFNVQSFVKISLTVFNLQSGHEYMVEMAMLKRQ